MRLLLDTHVVFWAVMCPKQLLQTAVEALGREENVVFVSVASAWEIAIKVGLGKWPEAAGLIEQFEMHMDQAGFEILPISVAQVRQAGLMAVQHRDPFDRLIVAQAQAEGLTLLSADAKVQTLGAAWLW